MDPVTGLAIAGTVLQGAGILQGFQAGGRAQRKAKQLARAQQRQLELGYRETSRQSMLEEASLRGQQRAAMAGAGAIVGRGTGRLLEDETSREFARARNLAAQSYVSERKAIHAGGQIGGPNYASGLASLASSIANTYAVGEKRGSWGQ